VFVVQPRAASLVVRGDREAGVKRRIRVLAAAAVLAVAAGACGSGSGSDPAPDPVAAVPARVAVEATIASAPVPAEVTVRRPDLRLDGVSTDPAAVQALPGVDYAAPATRLALTVSTSDGMLPVDALAVDPHSFRPLTPESTAQEPGVWQRLDEGNVVFTPAAANRVGAILGETSTLSGPGGTEALRVGALAANGVPQLADLLVPWPVGTRLGAQAPDTLVVAVADDADLDAVAASLRDLTGVEPTVLEEPEAQQSSRASIGRASLEAFTYQDVGDGTIRIDPGWVQRNIVKVDLPVLGTVRCHRIMIDQLAAALQEIQQAGLADLITDYAGCYVPRHMLWNPAKPISRHAWGLAFDINVPANGYGAAPTLDPRIVEVFRRWGFKWGGDFSTPDGMHFELQQVVRSS
jgi:hypothetical protein